MVRRVRLVSVYGFKESIRQRTLAIALVFAAAIAAAPVLLDQITAGQDVKIVKDLGLAGIELAGLIAASVMGAGIIGRDIERRSLMTVLAKPLARWEFILGKYVGLLATLAVLVCLMTMALFLVLGWMGWHAPPALRRSWEAPAVDPGLLLAVVLIAAELSLLAAIAVFCSTFSSNGLSSLLLTIGVWVAGNESHDLRQLGRVLAFPLGAVVSAAGWIVPAFPVFDLKSTVVHGGEVPLGVIAWRVLYAAVYASVALGASAVVFSRKELR